MRTETTFDATRRRSPTGRRIVVTLSGSVLAVLVGVVFGQVFRPDFRLALFMPESQAGVSEESLISQAPATAPRDGAWFNWLDQNQTPSVDIDTPSKPETLEPPPEPPMPPAPHRSVNSDYVPTPPVTVRFPSESGDILGNPEARENHAPNAPPSPAAPPAPPEPSVPTTSATP
jgi:hypothetical protein